MVNLMLRLSKPSFNSFKTYLLMSERSVDIKEINLFFVSKGGDVKEVRAQVGLSVLEVAHKNDISLEGACGAALACSTCHVIIEDEGFYDAIPEASEEEEDMLDLAFGLEKFSRLGCQIILTEEMDGMRIRLPASTRNILLE